MEAVAAAAGTSKPVLYRRWPDRSALLRRHPAATAAAAIPHQDTGSYRGDMLATCVAGSALFTGLSVPLRCGRSSAAMAHDADLAERIPRRGHRLAQAGDGRATGPGIARGDVRADVPVDIARELGQSVLWHRLLITGDPIDDALVVRLVDDVLVPFVAPRHRVT